MNDVFRQRVEIQNAVATVHHGGRTTRFHTLDTVGKDTVASHSFGVAWFAALLSGGTPSASLLLYCLRHDLAEHALGDIPSPVKKKLGLSEGFDAMEEDYLRARGLPTPELTADELRAFKLADNLDGLRFCISEYNRGNRGLQDCERNYILYIDAMNPHGIELDVYHSILVLKEKQP